MLKIMDIINELNENNSSLYKLGVLKKYQNDKLLERVLKMTYDKVLYTYGVSPKTISPNLYQTNSLSITSTTLYNVLDFLEYKLSIRELTGNAAREQLEYKLKQLSKDDAEIIYRILGRDLKINTGTTQINKVFTNLITKPFYMRCDTYSDKTAKKIKFPAFIQLKADGMFISVNVDNENVTFTSRSGETYEFIHLESIFKTLPNGVYNGELLVKGIKDRALANGFIKSDTEDKSYVYAQIWDYIEHEEYSDAKHKLDIPRVKYVDRFSALTNIIDQMNNDLITVIPSQIVNNIQEAMEIVSEWMKQEFEGGILKDYSNIFQDHTSKTQLKLKLEIECDVRITGFTEGSGKNKDYFGAITFENDEGTVKGKVGVSSMTEKQRDWFHENRDNVIGKIMEVQFNDLSKSDKNDYHALSHPRYIELRDKDETDTLEKIFKNREMAMQMKKRIK